MDGEFADGPDLDLFSVDADMELIPENYNTINQYITAITDLLQTIEHENTDCSKGKKDTTRTHLNYILTTLKENGLDDTQVINFKNQSNEDESSSSDDFGRGTI